LEQTQIGPGLRCMSFVPTPLQASSATASHDASKVTSTASAVADSAGVADASTDDLIFKQRTFDLFWVDKSSLMYKDGIAKSFDKDARKAVVVTKRKSSIPIILRDMAPPEGSIFDPAKKWEAHKEEQRNALKNIQVEEEVRIKKKSGGKKNSKKQSTADSIKESNAADKDKKEHSRDLQKLSNLKTLKALQEAVCETSSGKINRMLKMLHLAVCDLRQGSVNASEAEVLDILWALEEMSVFKVADNELALEKAAKKELKEQEKLEKKSSKKDSKKDKDKKSSKKDSKKDKDKKDKIVLSTEAVALKKSI